MAKNIIDESIDNNTTAINNLIGTANKMQAEINSLQTSLSNLQTEVNNIDLLAKVYPVGSIYISTNNTSPQSFLGGTWQKIEGRFLLSSSSGYSNGSTGGESSHQLTKNEMPNYKIGFLPVGVMDTHGQWSNGGIHSSDKIASSQTSIVTGTYKQAHSGDIQWGWDIYTDGNNAYHNNMPPYFVVNMWKRIA